VGAASGSRDLIAVVADPSHRGEKRHVRAYVCDGQPKGTAEWFSGSTSGNTVDLTSVSGGAKIHADLTSRSTSGTVTLGSGRPLNFKAIPAEDGTGLYTIKVSTGGERGSSEGGAKLTAHRVAGHRVSGRINLPNGKSYGFTAAEPNGSGAPDTYTAVFTRDRVAGVGGKVKGGEPSSNFYSSSSFMLRAWR
jgi:hypothetical protein